MDILSKIKKKSPEYHDKHDDLIMKLTVSQGGQTGTAPKKATWEKGKFFFTRYEAFMYATFLGIRHESRAPIEPGAKKKSFYTIENWKPSDLVDYMIMAMIGKSHIDLYDLEQMEPSAIDKELNHIKRMVEEYANGGFGIIRDSLDSHGEGVLDDDYFVDLLDE